MVLPRDGTRARNSQSRTGSRAADRAQRIGKFQHDSLDSRWIEKRWLDDRIAVRVGQFAGQDFYGNAQYGSSFIIDPLNYSLGNLGTTFETDNPFATPAAEIRIAPLDHFYLKSMVMAGEKTR
jgi:carbohydrate-selective porin OprB